MTTNWQRPRDEHGRFAKPAADLNGTRITYTCALCSETYGRCTHTRHEFELGPRVDHCRRCGLRWTDHLPTKEFSQITVRSNADVGNDLRGWWLEFRDPPQQRRLLVALPFVIALLGLGFSIAALIVGVQR